MKGKWKKTLGAGLLALALSGALGMAACGDNGSGGTPDLGGSVTEQQIMAAYEMYKGYMAEKDQTPLTYEEWLASLKGEKGDKPVITIVDGYWYVDGVNTHVKAVGEDAQAPEIEIVDGYWYVNGKSTGVKATGENGAKPVITINKNGYWCVDGVSTGVKAKGEKGDDGEDGVGIDDIAITYGVNGDGETVMIFTFYMSNGQTMVKEVVIGENPPEIPDNPDDPDDPSQGGGEDDEPKTYTVAEGTPLGGFTVTLNDDGSVSVENSDYTFTYEWKGDALGINDGYSTYYFAVEENALVAYIPDMDYETYALPMMDAFVYIYNDNSTQSGEYYVRSYREFENEGEDTTEIYTSTFSTYVDFEKFELSIEGTTFSFADGETLRPFKDLVVSDGSILGENVRFYQDSLNGGVIVAGDDEYEWLYNEDNLIVIDYPMNDVMQEILFTIDQNNVFVSYVPDGATTTYTTYTNAEMDYSLCLYDEYCVIVDVNGDVLYTCARVEENGLILIAGMKVALNDDFTYSFVTDGGEDNPDEPDEPTLPDGVEYVFVGEVAFQVDMRVNKIELYDDNTAKMYYVNEADEYEEWTNLNETVVWMLDDNALYLGLGNEPCALFGVDTENGTLSEYDFANETVENVYTWNDGANITITTYENCFLQMTAEGMSFVLPYETDGETLTLLPTSYGMSFTINDDNTLTLNGGGTDDPSEVTVVGVYTYTNASGQSFEMTLYSNNTVEQDGSVLPCRVEGNILRVMMGGSPIYFELGETEDGEKVMTDYVPELPILNTYIYQDYGMRFTVYGVYNGAGAYIAIYSIPTTTGMQQATTEVSLDLDAGILTHAIGAFTINDDNTLTLNGGTVNPENPNPGNPTVEIAYTLTGNVYFLIEQEVVKMELWDGGKAFIYGVDENDSLTPLYPGIVTWEMVNDLTSKSTDLKLYLKGEPCAIYNVDLENGTFSEYVFDEKMKDATYTYTETEESQDGTSTYTQTFTTYLNGFALWSDDDGDSAVVAYTVSGNVFRLLPSGFGPTFIIGENNELTVDESVQSCEECGKNPAVTSGYCEECYNALLENLGNAINTYITTNCYFNGKITLYEGGNALIEGVEYIEVMPYTLSGTFLTIHAENAPIYLTVDDTSGYVTNYTPTEKLIGTYVYTESSSGATAVFTYAVYGNTTGKGVYKCVMTQRATYNGEVMMNITCTSEVEFDLQGIYLYHAGHNHGYQINADNTLTLVSGKPLFGAVGNVKVCNQCHNNPIAVNGLCQECYESSVGGGETEEDPIIGGNNSGFINGMAQLG